MQQEQLLHRDFSTLIVDAQYLKAYGEPVMLQPSPEGRMTRTDLRPYRGSVLAELLAATRLVAQRPNYHFRQCSDFIAAAARPCSRRSAEAGGPCPTGGCRRLWPAERPLSATRQPAGRHGGPRPSHGSHGTWCAQQQPGQQRGGQCAWHAGTSYARVGDRKRCRHSSCPASHPALALPRHRRASADRGPAGAAELRSCRALAVPNAVMEG